jgi:hypothetical protein
MNRRAFTLFTLIVLLWELLDPSTSFIRSYVVHESGALSKASPLAKTVSYSSATHRESDDRTDDANHDDPSPSLLDTDQVHYSCVVTISVFDFDPGPTMSFVAPDMSVLPEHDSSIFQPPKHS